MDLVGRRDFLKGAAAAAVSAGPAVISARGQNDKIKCSATQIQDGRSVTIAPQAIANGKPMLPMRAYDKR